MVMVMVIVRNDASDQRDECEETSEGLHDVRDQWAKLRAGSKLKRRP